MRSTIITDANEWDAFCAARHESQFLQSWHWGEFQQALGRTIWRLGVRTEDTLVAAALVIKRQHGLGITSLTVYRGPVVSETLSLAEYTTVMEQLFADFQDLAKTERATHIHVEPPVLAQTPAQQYFVQQTYNWKTVGCDQPQTTWMLNVEPDVSELEQALHPKTRYNIHLAERKGVTVSVPDKNGTKIFLDLLHTTTKRNRTHAHSDTYYTTMIDVLEPTGMLTFPTAFFENKPLATNLMIRFGDTVTYVHGGSSNEARNIMAPYLLQWSQIVSAKEHGAHWYDFGGVAPQGSDEAHPWFGITRFKHGFGGEERRFLGGREQILRSFLYRLVQLRRRLRK